ncbi:MAG TPA: hypothetical protein VLJ86_25505 [Ramlibacter sp.]|nr:hypothetical protein [Ramlibacter sp.]
MGAIVGCLCLHHGHDAIDPQLARVVTQRVIIAADLGCIDGAQLEQILRYMQTGLGAGKISPTSHAALFDVMLMVGHKMAPDDGARLYNELCARRCAAGQEEANIAAITGYVTRHAATLAPWLRQIALAPLMTMAGAMEAGPRRQAAFAAIFECLIECAPMEPPGHEITMLEGTWCAFLLCDNVSQQERDAVLGQLIDSHACIALPTYEAWIQLVVGSASDLAQTWIAQKRDDKRAPFPAPDPQAGVTVSRNLKRLVLLAFERQPPLPAAVLNAVACAVAAVQLLQQGSLREPDPRVAAAGLRAIARMAYLEDLAELEARLNGLLKKIQTLEQAQPVRADEEPMRGLMERFQATLRSAVTVRNALSSLEPAASKAGLREK